MNVTLILILDFGKRNPYFGVQSFKSLLEWAVSLLVE